ncbi:hypothetical protein BpHYR1_014003, partial [Brachionus plicatilis]
KFTFIEQFFNFDVQLKSSLSAVLNNSLTSSIEIPIDKKQLKPDAFLIIAPITLIYLPKNENLSILIINTVYERRIATELKTKYIWL